MFSTHSVGTPESHPPWIQLGNAVLSVNSKYSVQQTLEAVPSANTCPGDTDGASFCVGSVSTDLFSYHPHSHTAFASKPTWSLRVFQPVFLVSSLANEPSALCPPLSLCLPCPCYLRQVCKGDKCVNTIHKAEFRVKPRTGYGKYRAPG